MVSIWRILKGRTVPSGGRRGQSSPYSTRTRQVWRGRLENRTSSSPPCSLLSQYNGRTHQLSTHVSPARLASVLPTSCCEWRLSHHCRTCCGSADGAERLLLSHNLDLGVATHTPHDDGAFLHRARFMRAVADADVVFVYVSCLFHNVSLKCWQHVLCVLKEKTRWD